jgi:hypothetical protein
MDTINMQNMLVTTMHMSLINKLNSNTGIINTIICLCLLTIVPIIINYIKEQMIEHTYDNIQGFKLVNYWYGVKNQIEFSGKTATLSNQYDLNMVITNSFSDSFKALWHHLNESINTNKSIYKIKEIFSTGPRNTTKINKKEGIFYIVSQKDSFMVDKALEIYAFTSTKNENSILNDNQKNNNNNNNKIEQINITLFSYKSSIATIQKFVDDITESYLNTIAEMRENKKFIYDIIKTKYDDNTYERWNEHIFESNRTFNNLFFDKKEDILSKVDFFLNNEEWYNEKGIPYTLGIGLHGPPGTGKTSFIKALANKTKRHIINFSFKIVKTKKDLISIFFEDRYNVDNKKGTIGFDKKIIVFEDIDCIGDIILNRDEANKSKKNNTPHDGSISSIIEKLVNIESEGQKEAIKMNPNLQTEEPITLDDILNIWDGIRETPGRIIIISSNHYKKLDPALTRPGRIDISLELTNASHNTIDEIYFNLFKKHINPKKLNKIKQNLYSPAEILNIYIETNFDENKMINRLQENRHVV